MKICTVASVLICRHIQTSIMKLRDILLQLFITNMPKKLLEHSWKYYQALFSVVEQLKCMPNLPIECSRENYTQLASLCNIKVKQEFELIMLDIKVTHVNIYINEPIKIMA